MKYVQAQFSLKYEPQIRIRRDVNQIEDFLEKYYCAPQTMPIPDEFAAEAPRIVLNSKNNHSQISFSQISVDFTTKFTDEYVSRFDKTKEYISKRVYILKELLKKINIKEYYYFGLTYSVHLDVDENEPTDFMKKYISKGVLDEDDIYEASQRIALIKDDKYFINKQVGTFKEYQSNGTNILNLMDFKNSKLIKQGISALLDINNRYQYLSNGVGVTFENFEDDFEKIFELIEININELE